MFENSLSKSVKEKVFLLWLVSSRREKQKQEKKKGLPVGEKAKLKKWRIFGFGASVGFSFQEFCSGEEAFSQKIKAFLFWGKNV